MASNLTADLCVIGAGSGGLSVAAGAALMGVKVILIEKNKMGGDCLNYGCVPSKSLLAASKLAHKFRTSDIFGIQKYEPEIDMSKIMNQVQSVINNIAPHDSTERFEKMGVKVILGSAKFTDTKTVAIQDTLIKSRYYIIATGSFPVIPKIPGIETATYYTNETIFSLQEKPKHLIIIGGGPIGCELAQAFLFLGVKVTILEMGNMLPHDEKDLVNALRQRFISLGLNLFENTHVLGVSTKEGVLVKIEKEGTQQNIEGSHLLVATGRKPDLQGLNLEAAKVKYNTHGIEVNSKLRTSNSRVFAAGDVAGSFQFTHIANYHAGIVLRNTLFKLPAKVDYSALPWVTYTHPELAHVGMSSEKALEKYPKAKILSLPLSVNDRAQTDHDTFGQIKIITTPKGKILGATILAPNAGELLLPWILAIQNKQNIKILANVIIPYPTYSELTKQIASEFYKPILTSSWVKFLVKLLKVLG